MNEFNLLATGFALACMVGPAVALGSYLVIVVYKTAVSNTFSVRIGHKAGQNERD